MASSLRSIADCRRATVMPAFRGRGGARDAARNIARKCGFFARSGCGGEGRREPSVAARGLAKSACARSRLAFCKLARGEGFAVRKEGRRVALCPGLLRRVDERGRRVAESVQATRARARASLSRLPEEPFCKTSPKTQAGRLRCQSFLATVSRPSGRRRTRRRVESLWPPVCFSSRACRCGRR
jgi:hypothetical protein